MFIVRVSVSILAYISRKHVRAFKVDFKYKWTLIQVI